MTWIRAACLVTAGLLVATTGCGGGSQGTGDPTARDKLEEVKSMLQTVAADRQKPPSKVADLSAVEPMLPIAASAIRQGDLVYVWGTTLSPGGNGVVAYEKDAPTGGGWVLTQDGTIKQMTAAEFQAAPKADKK